MKKLLLIPFIVFTLIMASSSVNGQQPLTGEKYFNGTWIVNVADAPDLSVIVTFYNNEENKFVGSIGDGSGAVNMLDGIKVEGNTLSASTYNPEMGTITIKIEKKDENTATGSVMDGMSLISCKRYVPEK